MTKNNKPNINVNKDDPNINDYLYCWSEMGSRPSKKIVYKNYESKAFLDFLSENKKYDFLQQEIIPLGDDDLINERCLIKLEESIWVSFWIYDSKSEESFIGELIFIYDPSLQSKVDDYKKQFDNLQLSESDEYQENTTNLFGLIITPSGFELEPIQSQNLDSDNIECYYNNYVFNQFNKLSKKINKTKKGLSIIFGERGTGKTSIIKYLSENIKDKKFIFIPTTFFDLTINNPEFRTFLKKNSDSVIVLDDCELYFSDIYSKSNIFTNNLLQLVDGLDSDQLGLNLLLILNCDKESEIDSHLLDSNSLLDIIYVDYLKKSKINDLLGLLDKKRKINGSTKLIDVLKKRFSTNQNDDIGF